MNHVVVNSLSDDRYRHVASETDTIIIEETAVYCSLYALVLVGLPTI